jgi:hypothetical protein
METYLTVCYGRPSSTFLNIENDPFLHTSRANLNYLESMYLVCGTIAKTLQPQSNQIRFVEIMEAISAVKKLEERALPHLQNKANGRTVQDRLEYFCLQIHSNFSVTYLTLRAIKTSKNDFNMDRTSLAQDYEVSCKRTLQAFLDMQAASGLPERNWVFLHNCLTSALLLGYGSTKDDFATKRLPKSFFNVLMHLTEEAKTAGDPQSAFSSHHSRAIEDLENMCTDVPNLDLATEYPSSAGGDPRLAWEDINFFDSILLVAFDSTARPLTLPQTHRVRDIIYNRSGWRFNDECSSPVGVVCRG